eukprot:CAMPEP_0113876884 /NCGR_PEP_ID=MMETSP0780_2-20120614/5743_1 /TAXON_ID=652834 /ORGANISM="Palpitomonas bilix" /LENGTH=383 /DNA_ID=CAMNT_0000863029 /DNA_START=666 /DNA_END=1817 /DNA_ORIENTATION=+ /assembly_acc=CAM_ASM_000599
MSGFGTRAIHAGQEPDPHTGAVMPAISLSTTFIQKSPGVEGEFAYSRSGNPNRNALEACLASLEKADFGFAFSSGLAASDTILALLKPGDHLVAIDDVYGGTNRLIQRVVSVNGLEYSFADVSKEGELEKAITEKTKMVWVESPTNPTLKISDIKSICEVAHSKGCLVVVDNTFMSPYFQNPIELGADIVMHSVTKFINGHSDVVMGFAATSNKEVSEKLRFFQNARGPVPSPFDCYLVLRSLKTLHVRMPRHGENAMKVAQFLEGHDKVERVSYPGLESHPGHEVAKKQMKGFGGMITFWLKGGLEQSRQLLENLSVVTLAESLGGVESLIEHPALMTHQSVPPEMRKELGIDDSLIRLSVGIEDFDDIKADLSGALDKVVL